MDYKQFEKLIVKETKKLQKQQLAAAKAGKPILLDEKEPDAEVMAFIHDDYMASIDGRNE